MGFWFIHGRGRLSEIEPLDSVVGGRLPRGSKGGIATWAIKHMPDEKVVLGDEWEEDRLTVLMEVLGTRGAELRDSWAGMAGSQFINHMEFVLDGGDIVVETETYEGITVAGESSFVRSIERDFRARLPD